MIVEAVGLALDKRRTLASACTFNGLSDGSVDRLNVHAVNDHTRDAVGMCTHCDVLNICDSASVYGYAVKIVFADVNNGQLPR